MTAEAQRRDPFRTLAIVSIVLGMLIVISAVVLYYVTSAHVASPLIFGTGLTLSIGGPLPNMLGRVASAIPDYQPPEEIAEPEPPPPPPPRRPPAKKRKAPDA